MSSCTSPFDAFVFKLLLIVCVLLEVAFVTVGVEEFVFGDVFTYHIGVVSLFVGF